MRRSRKRYTPQEKVAILREHLLDRVPVSDVCEKHGISPAVFYRWQKQFFEHGAAAFDAGYSRKIRQMQAKLEALQSKLQRKDEVLSELTEEHIALKKTIGLS